MSLLTIPASFWEKNRLPAVQCWLNRWVFWAEVPFEPAAGMFLLGDTDVLLGDADVLEHLFSVSHADSVVVLIKLFWGFSLGLLELGELFFNRFKKFLKTKHLRITFPFSFPQHFSSHVTVVDSLCQNYTIWHTLFHTHKSRNTTDKWAFTSGKKTVEV